MNDEVVRLLVCPYDQGALVAADNGFSCVKCNKNFPVVNGIPRFVEEKNYAASFGFEWEKFAKTQVDSFNNIGQSVYRIEAGMGWHKEDVVGKTVLDVGCGSGRFSEVIASWGGKVVGLDYSTAVNVAKNNTDALGFASSANYVQGDALKLPFADNSFDAVLSIGVLQHTANPLQALREMCRVLKPGGLIGLHGVYVRSLKFLLHPKYILRPITTKIPTNTLFKIVKWWVGFALPISRFMRKKLKMRQGLVERLLAVANYEGAVPGINDSNVYDWALLDTFDWFSPTYDNPLTQQEVETVFRQCNIIKVEHFLNGIDYRGVKSTEIKRQYNLDPDPYNTHMLLVNEVPDNSKVLEIGSASGYFGEYLTSKKHCSVWGVEPDASTYQESLTKGYVKVFNVKGEEFFSLPEVQAEKFDIIFLSDVLEHMENPGRFLSALRTYLKPEGKFVISIPNVAIYWVRWRLLMGKWDMEDGGIMDRTHLRFFTYKTMHELLSNAGLQIVKERPSGGYLERFGKRKLFGIGRKIFYLFPKLFSMHYIFVCRVK